MTTDLAAGALRKNPSSGSRAWQVLEVHVIIKTIITHAIRNKDIKLYRNYNNARFEFPVYRGTLQVYNIIRIVLLLRFVIAAMPLSVSRHSFHPRRHAFGGQCLLGWLCVYIRCLTGIRRCQTRYRRAAFSWCTLYDAREQSKRIYILRDRMRSSHA